MATAGNTRSPANRIDVATGTKKSAHCLDGANAAPPEDCGGIDRYYDILAAVRDSTHPEHEELRDWLGDDFDPGVFDVEVVKSAKSMPI